MKLLKSLYPFVLSSLVGGVIGAYLVYNLPKSDNQKISEFYEAEIATVVSPTALKKMIDEESSNYILVDLRSSAEYEKEHFKTAINIPAVSMNTEQLIKAFSDLTKDKQVIIHCYSAYCTLGRQVGKTLSQNDIYVKELTVGWSELRYHWDLWNPGAKVTDGESYIIKGSNGSILPEPCLDGEFGC